MLANIHILATGGTIAGSAADSTQTTGYTFGQIGVDALIAAIPGLSCYASITGEQIANIGSHDMEDHIWLSLAARCNALLARNDTVGIVITHGTDTMEETAYFLNLTVKSDKPVVLTGAMLPATSISADGPINILNAVRLAASEKAHGKGVLIALNGEINSARDTTKTSTANLATFRAPELGLLGYITGGEISFYRESTRRHTAKSEFDVSGLDVLPPVAIIYSHAGENRTLIDAAVAAGVRGIVYAGTGMGSIHKNALPALINAEKQGLIIVRGTRAENGVIAPSPEWSSHHFISADTLNAQKARILLQLALTKTSDWREIQRMFGEY